MCGPEEKQTFSQSVYELVLGEIVRRNLLLKVCAGSSLFALIDECVRRFVDAGKSRASMASVCVG